MWEVVLVKFAVLFGTDKNVWKMTGALLVLLLSPFLLCILVLLSIGNARIHFEPSKAPAGDANYVSPIVTAARSRIGDPYSQEFRGTADYVDCSYLTMWVYAQVGISIPDTAAGQGQFIEKNHWQVSSEEMQPGDLIFYSYEANGRYKDITHVVIYAGNGMVVHASDSRGCVVECELFDEDRIVLIGRPFKTK